MEIANSTGQSKASSRNLKQWVQQHPLFSYFFLAYAISWIVFIPYVFAEWGYLQGDYKLFYILHVFGPAVAAIIMIRITSGQGGIHELRQSIRQLRAPRMWYLFVLLGIPALVMLGIILQPGALESYQGLTTSMMVGYPFYLIAVFFGVGLGEEPGWRGFALPRIQKQYGPLWGTLLLGLLWSCWHLPDFLTASKGGGPGTGFSTFLTNFPIFTLAVMSLAVIMTWIYNHTNGSLFITILAHASVDAPEAVGWTALFPAVSMIGLHWALLISFSVPAILIIILTRGWLGYQSSEE